MSSPNSNQKAVAKALADDYWNNINRLTREKAFYAIMERLYKAIDQNKGYEDVFKDLGISIDGTDPSQSGFDVIYFMLKHAKRELEEREHRFKPRNEIIDELIK